jgi:hypothetical protein
MVESMRQHGFACLRGGRRTRKGGFRNRAAVPHEKSLETAGVQSFYKRRLPRVSFDARCKIVKPRPPFTSIASMRVSHFTSFAGLWNRDRSRRYPAASSNVRAAHGSANQLTAPPKPMSQRPSMAGLHRTPKSEPEGAGRASAGPWHRASAPGQTPLAARGMRWAVRARDFPWPPLLSSFFFLFISFK